MIIYGGADKKIFSFVKAAIEPLSPFYERQNVPVLQFSVLEILRLHAKDRRSDEMLPDRWPADHFEEVLIDRLEVARQKAARQRDLRQRQRAKAQVPYPCRLLDSAGRYALARRNLGYVFAGL